jgi:hypothetical protein
MDGLAQRLYKAHVLKLEAYRDRMFTTPLAAKTDAHRLKELEKRFHCADFHLTDIKNGLRYKVGYDPHTEKIKSEFPFPQIRCLEEDKYYPPFFCFPRPFKLEISTATGVIRDITYFFN